MEFHKQMYLLSDFLILSSVPSVENLKRMEGYVVKYNNCSNFIYKDEFQRDDKHRLKGNFKRTPNA